MKLVLEILLAILLFIREVHLTPVDNKEQSDAKIPEKDSVNRDCYYKIVGSQGSIYSPHITKQNVTCEWKIDVTKGFFAVLEFEHLRLPVILERVCDTYVEISYGTQNDPITRKICPTDKVDKIHTYSQVVFVKYHAGMRLKDGVDSEFGFKINYSASTITTAKSMFTSNYAVMILLLSMATMCVIAVCLFCFRCRLYGKYSGPASDAPNVPTRQQLQETFEFQRSALQAERKQMSFSIFQSEGSSFTSNNLTRWASNPHLPSAANYRLPRAEKKPASIMTTPRSVFPELRRKWSEESIKRFDHLRTKLVARFSSASSHNTSSDISVFFPASERRATYSQLSCEEDNQQLANQENEKMQHSTNRESRTASSSSKRIPSIVIEFVE